MEECVRVLTDYFTELTEKPLKQRNPTKKPIVGEPPLIKLIRDVQKGNFMITAHTGAGKTTLGLLLYHKARLKELPYDVIYVNMRDLHEYLYELVGPISSTKFEEALMESIFKAESTTGVETRKKNIIFSTKDLDIDCKNPYDCIESISEHADKTRLILFFDELEKVPVATAKLIADWFTATRRFYDEKFLIPVKVVVALPKVLSHVDPLKEEIKKRGEAVMVFTEFREYAITSEVLWNYFTKLDEAFDRVLSDLRICVGFRELIRLLGFMVSGRFSIPLLRRAISLAICKFLGQAASSISTPEDIIKLVKEKKSVESSKICIGPADVLDPILEAILEGKPFKVFFPRDMRNMWKEAASIMCSDLGSVTGVVTYGYQNFICRPNITTTKGTPIIWLTLAKTIGVEDVKAVSSKVINIMLEHGEQAGLTNLNMLVLSPEFTSGLVSTQPIQIESKREAGKTKTKVKITIDIKARRLGNDEVLSIARKGYPDLPIDSMIAEQVYRELVEELKSPRWW